MARRFYSYFQTYTELWNFENVMLVTFFLEVTGPWNWLNFILFFVPPSQYAPLPCLTWPEVLGNTSKFQSLWQNLSISWLQAHPVSTILHMFPHTADNSIIHPRTHLWLYLCLSVKSRPPMYTPRYSASTIIVLLIPLFGHHCGCIYLFVLSVIPYITQDSS